MDSLTLLLLAAAVLLCASVVASKASGRLGVPVLLVFLAVGMLAGEEGIGGIVFNDARLAQAIGIIALIFILHSGGLETDWREVRPVLKLGMVLATAGVLMTALLVALFAVVVLGYEWRVGLLLGSIVSSTDAAAVFAVLRSRGVGLRGGIKPLLELESGSNDPMAVFLTTATIGLLMDPGASLLGLVPSFVIQMGIGAAGGYLFGRFAIWAMNRIRLEYDGLYPVLSLGLAVLMYTVTTAARGNGFLAVYIAGIVVGNSAVIHRRSLVRFNDGVAWLMQIVMFLTLGLLVFPSRVLAVAGPGLLLSAVLILMARPLAVLVSMLPFRISLRKIAFVGWVGLRGAVPIILATYPLIAGVPQAQEIFNLVFFIVITSVLVQGSTIPLVARLLGVSAKLHHRPRAPLEFEAVDGMRGEMIEVVLPAGSPIVDRRILEVGLPDGALVVLVGRDGRYLIPSGGTQLRAADRLFVLASDAALARVERLVQPA